MNLETTTHCDKRMKQRSIPTAVLNWLDEYGARKQSNRSCEIVYFDKKSKRRLAKALSPQVTKYVEKFLNVYAVMSPSGKVITTGYRVKRIKDGY